MDQNFPKQSGGTIRFREMMELDNSSYGDAVQKDDDQKKPKNSIKISSNVIVQNHKMLESNVLQRFSTVQNTDGQNSTRIKTQSQNKINPPLASDSSYLQKSALVDNRKTPMTFGNPLEHNQAFKQLLTKNQQYGGEKKFTKIDDSESHERNIKRNFQHPRDTYLNEKRLYTARKEGLQSGLNRGILQEGIIPATHFELESVVLNTIELKSSYIFQHETSFEKSYNECLRDTVDPQLTLCMSLNPGEDQMLNKFINCLPYMRLLLLRKFQLYIQKRSEELMRNNSLKSLNKHNDNNEYKEVTDRFTEHQLAWAELLQTELSTQMMRYQLHLKNTRPGKYMKGLFVLAQDDKSSLDMIETNIEELFKFMLQYLALTMGLEKLGNFIEIVRTILMIQFIVSKEVENSGMSMNVKSSKLDFFKERLKSVKELKEDFAILNSRIKFFVNH